MVKKLKLKVAFHLPDIMLKAVLKWVAENVEIEEATVEEEEQPDDTFQRMYPHGEKRKRGIVTQ